MRGRKAKEIRALVREHSGGKPDKVGFKQGSIRYLSGPNYVYKRLKNAYKKHIY